MIHRRKGRKLNRTSSHRKALFSNLSVSLIKNKKIRTTLAKAKELRTYIEPLINNSKKAYLLKDSKPESNVHARRVAFGFLNDRGAVTTLFNEIAPKVVDRNGGYTRVLKMGRRLGDGAELALIELVDYNMEQQDKTENTADSDQKDGANVKGKTKKTKKGTAEAKDSGKPVKKKKSAETKKPTEKKKTTKDSTAKDSKKKEASE